MIPTAPGMYAQLELEGTESMRSSCREENSIIRVIEYICFWSHDKIPAGSCGLRIFLDIRQDKCCKYDVRMDRVVLRTM